MKTALLSLTAALVGALIALSVTTAATPSSPSGWRLAYAHDAAGGVTEGSKEALVSAILSGKPVRVYWAGTTVQHVADAGFLTVLEGEVFAQIHTITAQKPSTGPAAVELRDGTWQTVFATNGDRALRWFVAD